MNGREKKTLLYNSEFELQMSLSGRTLSYLPSEPLGLILNMQNQKGP